MQVSDAEAVSRAIELKERLREQLRQIPGVHGVGVGCKFVGGQPTNELALVVYLYKKRSAAELPVEEVIPSEIEGIKTDVREADLGQRCSEDNTRYRPLVGGSKIGWTKVEHPTPTSTTTTPFFGTLGCLARSRTTGKKVALTAAHVVTGCEEPAAVIAAGRRIGQPDDSADESCCSKCWATVFGTVIDASKDPDSAVIEIDKCVDANPWIQEIGGPNGALTTTELNALGGQPVRVRGYKTGEVRHGLVVDVSHDDFLPCSQGAISSLWTYHAAITVHPDPSTSQFGQPGDSGSPVVDSNTKMVGLFFGLQMIQGVSTPVVSRIDRILSAYSARWDLEILTGTAHAASPAPSASPAPAVHAFSAEQPEPVAVGNFQPTAEEQQLLRGARDQMLATPMGQNLSQLIGRHLPEIRALIHTQKRIAAVWQRFSTADLFRALVEAIQSPERPMAQFVHGAPLSDRIAAMSRVLARYGSQTLVADLKTISAEITDLTTRSYGEVLEWAKNDSFPLPEGASR